MLRQPALTAPQKGWVLLGSAPYLPNTFLFTETQSRRLKVNHFLFLNGGQTIKARPLYKLKSAEHFSVKPEPEVSPAYLGAMGPRAGVSTTSELEGLVSRSRLPWFCRFLTHICGSDVQLRAREAAGAQCTACTAYASLADTAACPHLGQLPSSLLMAEEDRPGVWSSMCCPRESPEL